MPAPSTLREPFELDPLGFDFMEFVNDVRKLQAAKAAAALATSETVELQTPTQDPRPAPGSINGSFAR